MMGIPFRVDGKGRVLISWMSRNKAYGSISNEGATRFAPRTPTPDGGKRDAAYPLALVNQKGDVLLVWLDDKKVNWAKYSPDGRFSGEQGQAGTIPSANKPSGFVGADDNYYIV